MDEEAGSREKPPNCVRVTSVYEFYLFVCVCAFEFFREVETDVITKECYCSLFRLDFERSRKVPENGGRVRHVLSLGLRTRAGWLFLPTDYRTSRVESAELVTYCYEAKLSRRAFSTHLKFSCRIIC
ncbi:hypothetical protein KQX54_010348 [Cotesia glomerata]|uniref:Uncharacterized protein n=1 Tax=Cotesia glomerata TaxID=32391 RepID=A0AAV7IKN5_COTGL|nr:hypothetical protein KQX54_010348 [Cotesia glomerata]